VNATVGITDYVLRGNEEEKKYDNYVVALLIKSSFCFFYIQSGLQDFTAFSEIVGINKNNKVVAKYWYDICSVLTYKVIDLLYRSKKGLVPSINTSTVSKDYLILKFHIEENKYEKKYFKIPNEHLIYLWYCFITLFKRIKPIAIESKEDVDYDNLLFEMLTSLASVTKFYGMLIKILSKVPKGELYKVK